MNENQTFPIDDNMLRQRKRQHILLDPGTLFIGAIGVAFPLALGLGPLFFCGSVLLTLSVMALYWGRHHRTLDARYKAELIRRSNEEQAHRLRNTIQRFRVQGFGNYADTLDHFLGCKIRIEGMLHVHGPNNDERLDWAGQTPEDIDNLADTITFQVSRQLNHLIMIERNLAQVLVSGDMKRLAEKEQQRREILEQILRAFSALHDTEQTLKRMVESAAAGSLPPPLPKAEASASLDDAIRILEEETAIRKRVGEFYQCPLS